MDFIQGGLFGRTSQERCLATAGLILRQSSNASQVPKFQCLVLGDGQEPEWCEADRVTSTCNGASSTLNIGESPSAEKGSTLLQVLEAAVPQKYYLSQRACKGILKRARDRGKKIPPLLEYALEEQMRRALAQETTGPTVEAAGPLRTTGSRTCPSA